MRSGAEQRPTLANCQLAVGNRQKALLDLESVEYLLCPRSPECGSIQGENRAPVRSPAESGGAVQHPARPRGRSKAEIRRRRFR